MGKVKCHYMGLEEDFWSIANDKIGECESFEEFEEKMLEEKTLEGCLSFKSLEDVRGELEYGWSEFGQSTTNYSSYNRVV